MALDFNDPAYPKFKLNQGEENHEEPVDQGLKTNVTGMEHPYFSANGVIGVINTARNLSNSKEKELSGKIPDKVFEDISEAARKTKVPYDLLLFACDWEKEMTSRSSAGDAEGIARKIVGYVPELRNTLSRDPMNAELFMAFTLQSASKVKTILEKSINQPEEEAKSVGTKKDDIILEKLRGQKTQKRNNREVYDYFYKRCGFAGKVQYHEDLGKDVK